MCARLSHLYLKSGNISTTLPGTIQNHFPTKPKGNFDLDHTRRLYVLLCGDITYRTQPALLMKVFLLSPDKQQSQNIWGTIASTNVCDFKTLVMIALLTFALSKVYLLYELN